MTRKCQNCGGAIAPDKLPHTKYCSRKCQRTFNSNKWRARNPEAAKAQDKRAYAKRTPEQKMLKSARMRAKRDGYPCTIELSDIIVPDVCPILGIALSAGTGTPISNSPSLDKIIPDLGYVAGNVRVISHRANSIKFNATLAEISLVKKDMEGIHNENPNLGPRVRRPPQ